MGIDHIISERLAAEGLEMRGEATPARLIRRVYLDLVGLPPPIEEVDAFVADPSDDRYSEIVDRLLASQHFGEKWATGWLDLARSADSDGYQRDGFRNAWPFRDWVIRAFNDDMPFDQFTIEQLAGDLLPKPTQDQMIATGFHRGPILSLEAGTDAEEERVKQVADRVNTTGTVWLATSLECAQCHDHKYDPISINDYYSMFAFFNNTELEGKRKPGEDDAIMEYIGTDLELPLTPKEVRKRKEAGEKKLRAKDVFVEEMVRLCKDYPREKLAQFDAKTVALFDKRDRTFKEAKALRRKIFVEGEVAEKITALEFDVFKHKRNEEKGFSQIGFAARVMRELPESRETRVMERGDFMTPGERVEAATPPALHAFPSGVPRNRLGLAQWIVAAENPLTARVAINRIWAELFGRGLVATMEDFGTQGSMPTHPRLLDWLAVTFRETDRWSMKKSIRRIVSSKTYKQTAVVSSQRRKRDPDNALYSRGPRNRLPAEMIRDNALTISGLIHHEMFGAPARPMQPDNVWRVVGDVDNNYYMSEGSDLYRRGVYTVWRRSTHYPSFANFDAPNRGTCIVQRQSSNTPLQALTLLNDPAYVEMAQAFAKRVTTEAKGRPPTQQLAHAFRLAVARQPTVEEQALLEKIYAGGGDGAWFDIATTLLNLHETITK